MNVRLIVLSSVLIFCASVGGAQSDPPTAPVPEALASAKRIFIGNAGDQSNADCLRAYNAFYAGVTALQRYQLVATPADADLILELHYEIALGQSVVSEHNGDAVRQFRVVLLEPKTHTVLWSLTESTNYAIREKNRNKNLDETMTALVKDFDQLTTAQPPANKSVIRH